MSASTASNASTTNNQRTGKNKKDVRGGGVANGDAKNGRRLSVPPPTGFLAPYESTSDTVQPTAVSNDGVVTATAAAQQREEKVNGPPQSQQPVPMHQHHHHHHLPMQQQPPPQLHAVHPQHTHYQLTGFVDPQQQQQAAQSNGLIPGLGSGVFYHHQQATAPHQQTDDAATTATFDALNSIEPRHQQYQHPTVPYYSPQSPVNFMYPANATGAQQLLSPPPGHPSADGTISPHQHQHHHGHPYMITPAQMFMQHHQQQMYNSGDNLMAQWSHSSTDDLTSSGEEQNNNSKQMLVRNNSGNSAAVRQKPGALLVKMSNSSNNVQRQQQENQRLVRMETMFEKLNGSVGQLVEIMTKKIDREQVTLLEEEQTTTTTGNDEEADKGTTQIESQSYADKVSANLPASKKASLLPPPALPKQKSAEQTIAELRQENLQMQKRVVELTNSVKKTMEAAANSVSGGSSGVAAAAAPVVQVNDLDIKYAQVPIVHTQRLSNNGAYGGEQFNPAKQYQQETANFSCQTDGKRDHAYCLYVDANTKSEHGEYTVNPDSQFTIKTTTFVELPADCFAVVLPHPRTAHALSQKNIVVMQSVVTPNSVGFVSVKLYKTGTGEFNLYPGTLMALMYIVRKTPSRLVEMSPLAFYHRVHLTRASNRYTSKQCHEALEEFDQHAQSSYIASPGYNELLQSGRIDAEGKPLFRDQTFGRIITHYHNDSSVDWSQITEMMPRCVIEERAKKSRSKNQRSETAQSSGTTEDVQSAASVANNGSKSPQSAASVPEQKKQTPLTNQQQRHPQKKAAAAQKKFKDEQERKQQQQVDEDGFQLASKQKKKKK